MESNPANAIYETDDLEEQYLLFHYAEAADYLPWAAGPHSALDFPSRCVSEGLAGVALPDTARALDVGCAVGRSAFELARHFREVVGIDYSARFIEAARRMREQGELIVAMTETGRLRRPVRLLAPAVERGRVRFEVGDAHDLPADLGCFDLVLAANLLCRLAQPQRFLCQLGRLLRPGGVLLLTTPHTWLESFTAPEFWLAGRGDPQDSLERIADALGSGFTLDRAWDLPLLIREHQRKYQWTVAQGSRWRRA